MWTHDVAIIGGGIVGLAVACRLREVHPDASVVVLEKEQRVAAHQSGHNSGVIHSGIFYEPGSLKAKNCREGRRALIEFCEREDISYEICGKVIVATDLREEKELDRIEEWGQKNGVACERIGGERLSELEPHVRGTAALHVHDSGIVDYAAMARAMAERIKAHGWEIRLETEVHGLHAMADRVTLSTTTGEVEARRVVNCAGLYADRIAEQATDESLDAQIVPFRGEYYELVPERRSLCRNLIYPVPDPAFPFLGVHFTRMIDGRVECGPSAVLAFAREGYRLSTVNWKELWETLTYEGFHRLAARHWKQGARELLQSMSKRAYLSAARRLIPELQMDDIVASRAGVRAQVLHPNGDLEGDFLIRDLGRVVNVINAPSPAATSALNIGQQIVQDYIGTSHSSVEV
ncbi:L-2-hydroxyglutarate oxidase [Salinibacter ruber]|uniref:L-2-hydroxyglutarate oxidase n=1 Tax=Salinibacter ruber TaxID=146919 RepID=UPI00216706F9|nr:L-2-hydroxyglutarate oxidase [Salinibacter ruber]MCS4039537.1 L-2-hydroxyglutarate oxidase [Salinibacter ruber]